MYRIVKALNKDHQCQYLTAKDIHELYLIEDGGYEKSIKTIYRYIEKLKTAGYIAEAGKRLTEGSRVVENLYTTTSEIMFFEDPPEEERFWNNNNSLSEYSQNIVSLMSDYFEKEIHIDVISDFLKQYYTEQDKIVDEIVRSADNNNEEIVKVYRKIPSFKINSMNEIAALLIMLMKQPEIFETLKDLVENK